MTDEQTLQAQNEGFFGTFGGRYVAETLVPALDELSEAHRSVIPDPAFQEELQSLLRDYVGRPTPLYKASRLSTSVGAEVWLKREDLCHTGAHKVNNTIGQVLLAKRMGKTRIIAETGAGQHGVATATACALLGLPCEVFMGAKDVARQAPNVQRMELLGAKVHAVRSGSETLKDAMNEALRDWVTNVEHTYYCVGSAAGPHPYPSLVRDLQAIIGEEARRQFTADMKTTGKANVESPDAVIACVGGGSNALGMFVAFLDDPVELWGIEAAGEGLTSGHHAATLCKGSVGVLHGAKTYVLQTDDGQVQEAHSISAGLDYPAVGPEHAHLRDTGRVSYASVSDTEALDALDDLAKTEGIISALETSHALAYLPKLAVHLENKLGRKGRILVCLSGRGDKDLQTVLAASANRRRESRRRLV